MPADKPFSYDASPFFVRDISPGIGQAVAERTILRKKENHDGTTRYETWGEVAERVATGNALLHLPTYAQEKRKLEHHIAKGTLLMSGRHLQHGDVTQPERNLEVYSNCLHKDTKILTLEHGAVEISKVSGQTVTVCARDGVWRPAAVKSYGYQHLNTYRFGSFTGNGTTHLQEVIATPGHRWFLDDGSVTTNLTMGDELEANKFVSHEDVEGIRHGFIFGDGSNHKRRRDFADNMVSQGREYCSIRFCGAKSEFLKYFDGFPVKYPDYAKGDPCIYLGKKPFLKDFPFCHDPSYIAGFIKGWWMADGSKTFNNGQPGRIEISTTREDALSWLVENAAFAGYTITGISRYERKEGDGAYANGKTLFSIRMSLGARRRVKAITYHSFDEVFCVEEPVTSGFVLANGLLTGNCSTSATSFTLFMLLLNGSGVGRCYDDDMMVVNWNYAPNLRVVLDSSHKDFDWSQDESVRDAKHKYKGENVVWHEVEDSREGWAKAIEIWEVMAYQKVYVAHTLVLDFSKVRPKGAPIMGMQGRPSSGPKPLMNALVKVATIKGAGMKPWRQALFVDHALAECVLVGGARRAARMATKHWKDKDILDFIQVKRPIEYEGMTMDEVLEYRKTDNPFSYLWSSNNSVSVDAEFWEDVREFQGDVRPTRSAAKAWRVLTAICEAAYGDGTGEPGLINVDKLNRDDTGLSDMTAGDFVGSKRYTVEPDTRILLSRLATVTQAKPQPMIVNPCSEIPLTTLGGYCVLCDVVPFHAPTLGEAEEAFRVAVRSLIRVNLMDNLYAKETARTNRIGVGVTGIHEFGWKFFRVGFRDLISPNFDAPSQDSEDPRSRAAAFWLTLRRFSDAAKDEAVRYSSELGVNVPHTVTTCKPSGSVSKIYSLTEGWHLPARAWYMRWVQFRTDDSLVETYRNLGYPTRELKTYEGTTIVGFPTQPTIASLGMGDAMVTANDATPEEQYKWLHLGEEYWLGAERAGQISYTLKYSPDVVSFDDFRDMLIEHQSVIKCCAVLPLTDSSAYEYLPESMITKGEYEEFMRAIEGSSTVTEDVDFAHIDCGTGGCPIDFEEGEKQ